jgi:hypothetical protein
VRSLLSQLPSSNTADALLLMPLRRSSTPPTILISLRDLIDDRAATVPVPVPNSLVSPLVIFHIPPMFVCNSIQPVYVFLIACTFDPDIF